MDYNFAKRQALRINCNWILISLLALLVIAVLLSDDTPSLQYVFGEKSSADNLDMISEMYEDRNYYTRTQTEYFFDTGYTLQEDNRDVKRYYAFWLDDGMVLCRTGMIMDREEYTDYVIEGRVQEMDSVDREVREEIVTYMQAEYAAEYDEVSKRVSYYIVDTTKNEWLEIVLTLAGYLGAAALVAHILYRLIRIASYETAKHYQQLEVRTGMSAEAVNEKISAEYREPLLQKVGVRITNSWVVFTKLLSYQVYKKEDIVWLYQEITRHRWYGLIPIGKSYAVVLGMKDGRLHEISIKTKTQSEKTLEKMKELCPQTICGYSDDLDRLFKLELERFVSISKKEREEKE